jgi:hypothetical protein
MTNDMFSPDGALEAFKATFDPTDEDGGLPMLLHLDDEDKVIVCALAVTDEAPIQAMLHHILPTMPRPKALALTAESWRLDPVTRERIGECVMITGISRGGTIWGRVVNFTRNIEAGTVEWEEPTDLEGGFLAGGVPTLLRQAMA